MMHCYLADRIHQYADKIFIHLFSNHTAKHISFFVDTLF